MKGREWLPFEEALVAIRADCKKYKISGCKSWQNNYVNKGIILPNIPRQPHMAYKGKGWVSWGHWLGTNSVCNMRLKLLSFDEAYSAIESHIKAHKINKGDMWYKMFSVMNQSGNIPLHPQRRYKGKGWISWGHWLRTGNKRGGQRRHHLNEDFFKKWSSDMAYILGFWFADGNIGRDGYFSICQHNKDKYLLLKFLDIFADRAFLYQDKRGYCNIKISSKTICKDIINLGGIPNKSLRVKFPHIPKKYICDFLRGNFDGDGSIYYDKANKKYFACFISGSKDFILGLKKFFDETQIVCNIVTLQNKNNPVYQLRFNALNTVKLGRYLYHGNPNLKMERKFELFQKSSNTNTKR